MIRQYLKSIRDYLFDGWRISNFLIYRYRKEIMPVNFHLAFLSELRNTETAFASLVSFTVKLMVKVVWEFYAWWADWYENSSIFSKLLLLGGLCLDSILTTPAILTWFIFLERGEFYVIKISENQGLP